MTDPFPSTKDTDLPEPLALSLRALGTVGEVWSADLPGLLAGLEAEWSITVGSALSGGQGGR